MTDASDAMPVLLHARRTPSIEDRAAQAGCNAAGAIGPAEPVRRAAGPGGGFPAVSRLALRPSAAGRTAGWAP